MKNELKFSSNLGQVPVISYSPYLKYLTKASTLANNTHTHIYIHTDELGLCAIALNILCGAPKSERGGRRER